MTFAIRLREQLELLGLPRDAIAARLGYDPSTITKWLAGSYSPRIEALIDICQLTNVSADYYLGLTNEPKPLKPP